MTKYTLVQMHCDLAFHLVVVLRQRWCLFMVTLQPYGLIGSGPFIVT